MDDQHKIKNLLTFIAVIVAFAALYVARDLFLPIVIGLLVALTFSPVVRSFARFGIPEGVTAAALILVAGTIIGIASYGLSGPISEIMEDAPAMGIELRQKLQGMITSLEKVQSAGKQVEDLATSADSAPVVSLAQPGLLAFAAGGLASFMGIVFVGLVLAMFILSSGDLFYVKLVQAFPNFSDKRRAIRTARGIERQISHYFLTITLINVGLGVCIGLALFAVGLPNPIMWGAIAFVLNFLPFVGGMIGVLLIAAYGILSFDTLGAGLLPAFVYAFINASEAQFVTPTILGRRLEMNTVSVFLTVIIWSWLWGVPGALMAVPFLVLLKVICTNVPGLQTLGNFLGPRTETELA
jgi:predicted PurR-regulated permease PerM